MNNTPAMVSIGINFVPIVMTSNDCEATPEPTLVHCQASEFVRSWLANDQATMCLIAKRFELAWDRFSSNLRSQFSGLLVFQRSLKVEFPVGEAAIIVSAEKYVSRSCSKFGVVSRIFGKNKDGESSFTVEVLDHPGETHPVPLGTWLQKAIDEVTWSRINTHFLSVQQSVHD